MLWQVGPVTIDVFPFNVDSVEFEGEADFARKDLLGAAPAREFTGPGDETLTLKGQILPARLGGMSELEALHGLRRAGERVIVLRGDGKVFGWCAIQSVSESHEHIGRDGVGFVVKHTIKLVRAPAPGAEAGARLLSLLTSLF